MLVKFSGLLANGRYETRIPAGAFTDSAGNSFAAQYVLNFSVLAGDLNGDGTVSIADFITLSANFGKVGATYGEGDVNYDQQVTIADFLELASGFGTSLAGIVDPMPMAAAAQEIPSTDDRGPLFKTARKPAKVAHHRKRTRPPGLAHRPIPFLRNVTTEN